MSGLMGLFSKPRLAELLNAQADLLGQILGTGSYSIIDTDRHAANVLTDWLDVSIVYDLRDRLVDCSVTPLNVPEPLQDSLPSHTLLRVLDLDEQDRRRGGLDDQQVIEALEELRAVVALLKDPRKATEAVWFCRGYSAAYTDQASGKWKV